MSVIKYTCSWCSRESKNPDDAGTVCLATTADGVCHGRIDARTEADKPVAESKRRLSFEDWDAKLQSDSLKPVLACHNWHDKVKLESVKRLAARTESVRRLAWEVASN